MTKRTRRNHTPAFKAKVALAVGSGVCSERERTSRQKHGAAAEIRGDFPIRDHPLDCGLES